VLIPDEFDAHGDIYDEATVRDACHHFMEYSEALGKQHAMALSKAKIRILECYLADTDCLIEGRAIKRGTWLLAARVLDDLLWQDIKAGRCTGWSIEGSALAELLI
jgi:DNA adenine methylase